MATLLHIHFTALKSTVFRANILLMRDLSVLTCFQFVCLVRSGFMCCCFPLSVSVAIKSVGPWNCRRPRSVNILTSVNIPPVVNLIAQTPTLVSVFPYSDTIWVSTTCGLERAGVDGAIVTHTIAFIFFFRHRNRINEQQPPLHLQWLAKISIRNTVFTWSLLTFWSPSYKTWFTVAFLGLLVFAVDRYKNKIK